MNSTHFKLFAFFGVALFLVLTVPGFITRLGADQVTCIDAEENVHQVYATRVEAQLDGGYKAWYKDELVGDFTGMRCARISPEMQ